MFSYMQWLPNFSCDESTTDIASSPVKLSVCLIRFLNTLALAVGKRALKPTSVELGLWSDVNDKQFCHLGDSLFSFWKIYLNKYLWITKEKTNYLETGHNLHLHIALTSIHILPLKAHSNTDVEAAERIHILSCNRSDMICLLLMFRYYISTDLLHCIKIFCIHTYYVHMTRTSVVGIHHSDSRRCPNMYWLK